MTVSRVVDVASNMSVEKAVSMVCGCGGVCAGAALASAAVAPIAVSTLASGVDGNNKMIKGVFPKVVLGVFGSVLVGGVVGGIVGVYAPSLILKTMELFLKSMAAKNS